MELVPVEHGTSARGAWSWPKMYDSPLQEPRVAYARIDERMPGLMTHARIDGAELTLTSMTGL